MCRGQCGKCRRTKSKTRQRRRNRHNTSNWNFIACANPKTCRQHNFKDLWDCDWPLAQSSFRKWDVLQPRFSSDLCPMSCCKPGLTPKLHGTPPRLQKVFAGTLPFIYVQSNVDAPRVKSGRFAARIAPSMMQKKETHWKDKRGPHTQPMQPPNHDHTHAYEKPILESLDFMHLQSMCELWFPLDLHGGCRLCWLVD